jgi:hypothetical protein
MIRYRKEREKNKPKIGRKISQRWGEERGAR